VCSQNFDHTSIVQFLERFTGVDEPNISAWRRRTFGDLTRTLRLGHRAPPRLPDTQSNANLATYEVRTARHRWPARTSRGRTRSGATVRTSDPLESITFSRK